MNIGSLALAATFAITGLCVHAAARIWSPHRLFFVELGRSLTEADRARARRVMVVNAAITSIGMALSFVTTSALGIMLLSLVAPLVPIGYLIVEMLRVAGSATPPAAPSRFLVPIDEPPSLLEFITPGWHIAHGALLGGSSAAFLWVLDRLPAEVPLHWNTLGQIDRWGAPGELWLFAAIMVFDWLVVWLVAFGVSRERWALPTTDAERYFGLQRRRRRLIVQMVETMMLGVNGSLAVFWLSAAFGALPGPDHWHELGIGVGLVLMGLGTIAPLVLYLRPLSDLQDRLRALAGSDVLGTRENGWVLGGVFYFAKDDPAVFVPKRIGIGQTLNFARPGAWLFLAAVTLLPLALTLLFVVTR